MTMSAVDPITAPDSASVDALRQVISALSLDTDFEKFFRKAAQIAADLVGADAAALITLSEQKQLTYKFFIGLSPEKQQLFTDYTLNTNQGVSGQVLHQKKSVFVPNYAAHPQSLDVLIEIGMRSSLAIPIIAGGRAIGILALSWFGKDGTQPSDHTLSFTETIASQIGLALERTQLEQNLTYRANHDDLTKLPSRGYFISHLKAALDSARRRKRLFALMVIDLDGFKAVNDQIGHAMGDELLCTVALRLNTVVRSGDVVGRLGGDEFVVLLEYKDWPDEPIGVADRILEALNIEVPGRKDTLAISSSIGIAIYPEDASDANTMLKNADLAMYQAKQYGGNQACLYNRDTAAIVRQRKEMIADVASALKNDDLVIYYQPVVDVTNNQIVAVEALVRWRLPDGSMRDAKEFITTVERHGPRLTLELGRHVLRTAMKQTLVWQQAELSVSVTVNISAREFLEEDFLPSLQSLLLEHTDFPADRLILEVSETGALEDTARASRIMNACRNLGVRFNIDNFGSGRAALSCLRELPIDFVKIDRSFVQGINESNRDKTVVGAIQTLARAYDAEVIAEGVETKEHQEVLLELGCHLMQGYYFSKALSAEQLTELLKTQHQGLAALP